MILEKRKIVDLVPYDKNPRKNEKAIEHVLESLRKHGQVKPIVLSAKGKPFEQEIIVAGHTTLEALKRFGATEVNVVIKDFEDEAEFVDYNIRDNKTGEFAEWDEKMLASLGVEFDIDFESMGFSLNNYKDEQEPDDQKERAVCSECGKKM